jgi:hypothetical protein
MEQFALSHWNESFLEAIGGTSERLGPAETPSVWPPQRLSVSAAAHVVFRLPRSAAPFIQLKKAHNISASRSDEGPEPIMTASGRDSPIPLSI